MKLEEQYIFPNYYDAGVKVIKVIESCVTKEQAKSAYKMYNRYMDFYKVRLVTEYPDFYLGGISKFEYHPLYYKCKEAVRKLGSRI